MNSFVTRWILALLAFFCVASVSAAPVNGFKTVVAESGRKVMQVRLSKDPAVRAKQMQVARNLMSRWHSRNYSKQQGRQPMNLEECPTPASCDPHWDWDFGGFEFYDEWSYWDSWSGEVAVVLERVEVTATRPEIPEPICSVTVSGPYGSSSVDCFDLSSIWDSPPIEAIEQRIAIDGLKEGVEALVELASPLLDRCMVTTTISAIKTPDQDASLGWLLARDTLLSVYAGNSSAIHLGVQFDVRYADGSVVRLIINGLTDISSRQVPLSRLLDGVPRTPSPCNG